ncbi:hypothetical protein LOD99_5736 [Oopsacas minuta]|uniref:Uncharacterized protein n=1 Tax=Oopsacas minuta TaxID=111878 RepID=A0AAV7JQB2_9METZ|nr:hypothetical protein LOD99_5736 [Oopsacas minuta]
MAEFQLLSENEPQNVTISSRSLSLLSINEKWFFHDLSPDVSNRILANTPLHTCFLVTNSIYTQHHFYIFVKYNKDDLRKIVIIQISPGHFQIAKSPTQTYASLFDAVYSAKDIHFKDVPPIFDRSELTPEALDIHSILNPPSYDEVLHYQTALKDLPHISGDHIIRPTEAADEDLSYPGGGRNRNDDDDAYYRLPTRSNWFVRLIEQRPHPPRKHWDLRNSGYLRIVAMLIFYYSTICIIPHVIIILLAVLLLLLVSLPIILILASCIIPYIYHCLSTWADEND